MSKTATTTEEVRINPNAQIKDLGLDKELMEEYKGLTGEDAVSARAHIKQILKQREKGIDVQPVPVRDWIHCPHPDCDHRTPGSLLSHIKAKHTSVAALADELGVIPEQINLVSSKLTERFKEAGAKGQAAKEAKAAKEGLKVEDITVVEGDAEETADQGVAL